jgi:peptide deformylase
VPAREIVLLGDPILRETARLVEAFDEELQELVRDMFMSVAVAEGAGLAAPQIGVSKQVLVADVREENKEPVRVAVVNPTIVEYGVEEERGSEGCLSVPGVDEVVSRPYRVVVEGFDPSGESLRIEAEGLYSRVLQHEVDHLNGILFFDRISPLQRRMLLRKYRKLRTEEAAKD